jgi:hypothetical protein
VLTFPFRRKDPAAERSGSRYARFWPSLAGAWCRCSGRPFRKGDPSGKGRCLSYTQARPSLVRAWCRCSGRLFQREDLAAKGRFARSRLRQTQRQARQPKGTSSRSSPWSFVAQGGQRRMAYVPSTISKRWNSGVLLRFIARLFREAGPASCAPTAHDASAVGHGRYLCRCDAPGLCLVTQWQAY